MEGALQIVDDARLRFPGYVPRFYVSQEIEEGFLLRLVEMGCEIVRKERIDGIDGMFWRFLAAADEEAEVVIIRDVDTRFTIRDKQAHDAWLASDKDFHIIRDHHFHSAEIQGGLWACRHEKIPHIAQLIDAWPRKRHFFDDQRFLSTWIYPLIRDRAYIQSDIALFYGEEVHPCPSYTDIGSAVVQCMGGYPALPVSDVKSYIRERLSKKSKIEYRVPRCMKKCMLQRGISLLGARCKLPFCLDIAYRMGLWLTRVELRRKMQRIHE